MRHLRLVLSLLVGLAGLCEVAHGSAKVLNPGDLTASGNWDSPTSCSGELCYYPLRGFESTYGGNGGADRRWTVHYAETPVYGLTSNSIEANQIYTSTQGWYYNSWLRSHDAEQWTNQNAIIIKVTSWNYNRDRMFMFTYVPHNNLMVTKTCRWLSAPWNQKFWEKHESVCSSSEFAVGARFHYDWISKQRYPQMRCCVMEKCSSECNQCSGDANTCTSCPIAEMSVRDGGCFCTSQTEIKRVDDNSGQIFCEPCPGGSKANAAGDQCVDINECTETGELQHRCSEGSAGRTCVDVVGGYNCRCAEGWSYNEEGRKIGNYDELCSHKDTIIMQLSPSSAGVLVDTSNTPAVVIDHLVYNVSVWNEQHTVTSLMDGYPKNSMKNGPMFVVHDLPAGKKYKVSIAACLVGDEDECEWKDEYTKVANFETECGCDASSPAGTVWSPGYRLYTMSSGFDGSVSTMCHDNRAGSACWTNIEADPFIRVDLGARHTIYSVMMAEGWWPPNTDDTIMRDARRGQIEIWLSDFPFVYETSGYVRKEGQICKSFSAEEHSNQPRYIPHHCEGNARYVTVLAPGAERALKIAELHIGLGLSPTSNEYCSAAAGSQAAIGTPCSFPFTWDSIQYDRCTTINNGNTPWCMTADDEKADCFCEYCVTDSSGAGNVHAGSPCVFPAWVGGTMYYGPITGPVPGGPSVSRNDIWCSVTEVYGGAWGKATCSSEISSLLDPVERLEMMDANPTCLIQGTSKVCSFPFIYDGVENHVCSTQPREGIPSGASWCQSYDDDVGECDCTMAPGYVTVETTGRPGSFKVQQHDGKMMYHWQDKSRCEEGFHFFRRQGSSTVSIADDYLYRAEAECGQRHAPAFIYEGIKEKGLQLGEELDYCLAAIGKMRELNKYVSEPACQKIRVAFETVVTGRVATALNKGNMPMPNTVIDWTLGSETGREVTDGEGKYKIHVISNQVLDEEAEMTVHFSRQTGNTTHKYLCDNVIRCTGRTFSVKHLKFDQVVDVVDDTVNPFSGRVTIGGTEHVGLEQGCPLAGVEVCLHSYPDTEIIFTCTNTSETGEYTLAAVLGTNVAIELTYISEDVHDFMRTGSAAQGNGTKIGDIENWVVEAESVYEFIDYVDITTANMRIEVAGGKCDRTIGDAELRIGIPHCPTWSKTVHQSIVAQNYEVPAHVIEVTFVQLERYGKPRGEVGAYFEAVLGEKKTIGLDLSHLEQAMDVLLRPKEAYTYRFEFHPPPTLTLEFSDDIESECKTHESQRQFVVEALTTQTLHVYAVEDFGDSNIQECDDVPGAVKIVSGLGVNDEWKENLAKADASPLGEEQIAISSDCHSDHPCIIDLQSEVFGNIKTAVDGDISQEGIDPFFIPSHCWDHDRETLCKADPGEDPWIELDLGGNYDLSNVVIWPEMVSPGVNNRTDPYDLGVYEIWISDHPSTHEHDILKVRQPKKCAEGDVSTVADVYGPFVHACEGNARYVTVKLPGTSRQLWFAEVSVFTPAYKNARASVDLVAVAPEPSEMAIDVKHPHTKLVIASLHTLPWEPTVVKAYVVVVGQYGISEKERISFPDTDPLMVIHDPPGSGSFAEYRGLKIRLQDVVSKKQRLAVGFMNFTYKSGDALSDGSFRTGWSSHKQKAYTCTPDVTFPLFFHACVSTPLNPSMGGKTGFDTKGYVGAVEWGDQDHNKGDFAFNWDDGKQVSIKINYKTSDKAVGPPGQLSDIFVIPGFSIGFIETRVVQYDFTECKAFYYDDIFWTVAQEAQKPVLNFMSGSQIKDNEIALLDKVLRLEDEKRIRMELELSQCQETPDDCEPGWDEDLPAQLDEQQVRFQMANDNKEKWQAMLEYNNNKKQRAQDDEFEWQAPARSWSDEDALTGYKLVPKVGFGFDDLSSSWQHYDTNFDALELRFSGGGSGYSLEEHFMEKTKTSHTSTEDEDKQEHRGELAVTASSTTIKIGGGSRKADKNRNDMDSTQQVATIKSFTLMDPDMGDVFTVKITHDPDFKTYYFLTKSGRSMCPHEPDTDARQKPVIRVVQAPHGDIMPDEKAHFLLEVGNDGTEYMDFSLFTDVKTNLNGLELTVDGNPIWTPLEYFSMPPESRFPVTVTAVRGKGYEFNDIKINFASFCEVKDYFPYPAVRTKDWQMDSTTISVTFAKLCPTVEFSGILKFDQWFTLNQTDMTRAVRPNTLRVEGMNTKYQTEGLWSASDRLLGVWLEFKGENDQHWQYARNGTLKLDLRIEENEYGFSFVDWDVSTVPDGNYRIRLRSECEASGSEAPRADGYTSSEISGVIDRSRPQQFGHVMPADGEYKPGKYIGVSFNEPIMCAEPYRFNIDLEVDDLDRTFNKRNMVIVCENNRIGAQFRSSVSYDLVMGKFATATFSGVEDLALNLMSAPAVAEFQFGEIDLYKSTVVYQEMGLKETWDPAMTDLSSPEALAITAPFQMEMTTLMGLAPEDAYRVQIDALHREGDIIAMDWTLGADKVGDVVAKPATELAEILREAILNADCSQEGGHSFSMMCKIMIADPDEGLSGIIEGTQVPIDGSGACPAVEWDLSVLTVGTIVSNADSGGYIPVVAYNPGESRWDANPRMQSVGCEYRKTSGIWLPCMTLGLEGESVEINLAPDEYNFKSQSWLSLDLEVQGELEVHLVSTCKPFNGQAAIDDVVYSSSIRVLADTVRPSVFGDVTPNTFFPGKKMTLSMSEEVNCDGAHGTVSSTGGYSLDSLVVSLQCEGSEVHFGFPGMDSALFELLQGSKGSVSIQGLSDNAGNAMLNAATGSFFFGTLGSVTEQTLGASRFQTESVTVDVGSVFEQLQTPVESTTAFILEMAALAIVNSLLIAAIFVRCLNKNH